MKAAIFFAIAIALILLAKVTKAEFVGQAQIVPVTFTVSQTSTPPDFRNGNFNDQLHYWSATGDVTWHNEDQDNARYVVLGSQETRSLPNTSMLSQTLSNQTPIPQLHFRYQLHSTETEPGFDQPSFSVFINDDLVYSANWLEIAQTPAENQSSGWHEVVIDTTKVTEPNLQLRFEVKTTGDDQRPTWVEIDDVSTHQQSVRFDLPPSPYDLAVWPNSDQTATLTWKEPIQFLSHDQKILSGWQYQIKVSQSQGQLNDQNWLTGLDLHLISLTRQTLTYGSSDSMFNQFSAQIDLPHNSDVYYLAIKKIFAAGSASPISPVITWQR